MKLCEVTDEGAQIAFTDNELVILQNALNEVCNGIDIPEFATRLGANRDEALRLLNEIHSTTKDKSNATKRPR